MMVYPFCKKIAVFSAGTNGLVDFMMLFWITEENFR